jgi:hypothetical protein
MLAYVESNPSANTEHIELGVGEPGKVKVNTKVAVIFVVTAAAALGQGRGRKCRDTQHQSAQYSDTFHVFSR